MTSRVPIGRTTICGIIALYLIRLLAMIAHIILLIYELARGSWDRGASSIMIVTLFTVVACFIIVFLYPREDRSNLSQARIAFASSLIQSSAMTGLLIACVMARPLVSLIVIHSINLTILYGVLAVASWHYHQLRLAPPNSSLHIPFDALIAGDLDRIRAARPDYTRKPRTANKKTTLGAEGQQAGEDEENKVATAKEPSQVPIPQFHQLHITSEGHILVGSGGDDERRWWEKW